MTILMRGTFVARQLGMHFGRLFAKKVEYKGSPITVVCQDNPTWDAQAASPNV